GGCERRGNDPSGLALRLFLEMKYRDVGALGQFDDHRIAHSGPGIILRETSAQIARLYPHDGIDAGVELFSAAENCRAESGLLQRTASAGECLLHYITKQAPQTRRRFEARTHQDAIQLLQDCSSVCQVIRPFRVRTDETLKRAFSMRKRCKI